MGFIVATLNGLLITSIITFIINKAFNYFNKDYKEFKKNHKRNRTQFTS